MSIIGMAVYSTAENKKDECLIKTLESLKQTVDFSENILMLSVNAFTTTTKDIIEIYSDIIENVIWNNTNIGTAEAINKVWQHRKQGEHAIKMDDDVVINSDHDWVQMMGKPKPRKPILSFNYGQSKRNNHRTMSARYGNLRNALRQTFKRSRLFVAV